MIGDGLTKDLSSLHPIEDGTGRRAGPSPLRVNRHRDTIGQLMVTMAYFNSFTCKKRRWRAKCFFLLWSYLILSFRWENETRRNFIIRNSRFISQVHKRQIGKLDGAIILGIYVSKEKLC